MRPLKRSHVSKHRSARKFRKHVSRTNINNVKGLARGGWML